MAPTIILHHLNVSRSDRIFWALEELGLEYQVKTYLRLPSRSAPPTLREVSPFGKAPIIEIDGEVITESAYIIQRLLQLVPDHESVETSPSNDSTFWAHFAEGSQMNLFQMGAVIGASSAAWAGGMIEGLSEDERKGIAKYAGWLDQGYLKPQNQTNLDQIEAFLSKRPGKYFTGSEKPGMGDFMMFFAINSLQHGSRKDAGYKIGDATMKWFEMVNSRPALKKGMDRLQQEEAAAKSKI